MEHTLSEHEVTVTWVVFSTGIELLIGTSKMRLTALDELEMALLVSVIGQYVV